MAIDLTQARQQNTGIRQAGAATNELDLQRLRILRCTAQAMASSPGGLRFKAGTWPWLEGLLSGRSDRAGLSSRRKHPVAQPLPIDR